VDMAPVRSGLPGLSGVNAVSHVGKADRSVEGVAQERQEIVQEMTRMKKIARIEHAQNGHHGESGHSAVQPVVRVHVTVSGHVDRVPGIQKRVQVMVLRWKRVIQVFAMVGVNGNPGHHVQSRVEPEIDREIGNVVF